MRICRKIIMIGAVLIAISTALQAQNSIYSFQFLVNEELITACEVDIPNAKFFSNVKGFDEFPDELTKILVQYTNDLITEKFDSETSLCFMYNKKGEKITQSLVGLDDRQWPEGLPVQSFKNAVKNCERSKLFTTVLVRIQKLDNKKIVFSKDYKKLKLETYVQVKVYDIEKNKVFNNSSRKKEIE